MHQERAQNLAQQLSHEHGFGAEGNVHGERRTWWVIGLAVTTMVVELVAGYSYGSLALLADGWHMGTHAAALGITVFAYRFARKYARDSRYSFGTGKVSALGGFASAVALLVVALLVLAECAERLWVPRDVQYQEALAVAVLGLLVNLASAWLLRSDSSSGADTHPASASDTAHAEHLLHNHADHNLRGAYFHVLADALTSLLAIAALAAGYWLGWQWTDPVAGIFGGLLIAHWSLGLVRDSSRVLLDAEVDPERCKEIRTLLTQDGETAVADLHLWRIGPRHLALVAVVASSTTRPPGYYRQKLQALQDLAHVTIEVHDCAAPPVSE